MEYDNLHQAYSTVCEKYAGNILFQNENITFAETWQRVTRRISFLKSKGHNKGDIIVILAVNSPDWCITYMAITAMGAIALPLDTNLTAQNYRDMLREVSAGAVFISKTFRGIFQDVAVYDIETDPTLTATEKTTETQLAANDIASLLFTSGTTGEPKIVVLTHSNILNVAQVCTELEEYTPNDQTLAMLPLYHVYAFESTFLAPLVTGSAIVFQASLKGPDIIRALAENKITIFPAAPQMWELFFDALLTKIKAQSMAKYHIFRFFLKSAPVFKALGLNFILRKIFAPVHDVFGRQMRFFISGGAPLKKEYFRYYRRMGFYIMEGYGLTETTGPIAIPYYKDAIAGAVGPPIAGNVVKIKNTNADGIGEIWLKGKAVMAGYYKNDEANNQVFDADRFFNTQDLGFVDRRGHIHITGREKNVIVLDSGKNVYPEELELFFRSSPLIAEIAVFGRMIAGRETAYAVIVPAIKGAGSYEAVREAINTLNKSLPSYKALTNFALSADPLPRNSTRKVLIDEVKRLLDQNIYQTDPSAKAVPRNILAPASVREEEIISILSKKLKKEILYANETLADYRIDSLGMIELIVYLEEALGIAIDTEKLNPLMTVEEFLRYLGSCDRQATVNLDEMILRGPLTTKVPIFRNPLSELIIFLVRTISRLCWSFKVINKDRLVPENAIIAVNHQSYLDIPWVLGAMSYKLRKDIYITGKKELSFLRYPFWGSPILFVDRQGNVAPALKAAADVLRSGNSLIIFPEGTRTHDGAVGKFRSGAAYLAFHLGKAIIPVTVTGAFEIMPRNTIVPRFFAGIKGSIIVGDTVNPGDFGSIDALNEHLHNVIVNQKNEENTATK